MKYSVLKIIKEQETEIKSKKSKKIVDGTWYKKSIGIDEPFEHYQLIN